MANRIKWDEAALDELKRDHEGGISVATMAEHYKVSRIRIYQLLKKAGVVIRGPHKNKVDDGKVAIEVVQ